MQVSLFQSCFDEMRDDTGLPFTSFKIFFALFLQPNGGFMKIHKINFMYIFFFFLNECSLELSMTLFLAKCTFLFKDHALTKECLW